MVRRISFHLSVQIFHPFASSFIHFILSICLPLLKRNWWANKTKETEGGETRRKEGRSEGREEGREEARRQEGRKGGRKAGRQERRKEGKERKEGRKELREGRKERIKEERKEKGKGGRKEPTKLQQRLNTNAVIVNSTH